MYWLILQPVFNITWINCLLQRSNTESKENSERQGRPLGNKKAKKNYNNITPRAKTRLPLRQNND